MRKKKTLSFLRGLVIAALVILPFSAVILPLTAAGASTNYYVSTAGSDSNSGTSPSSAWKTIGHAGSVVGAGSTVHVAPGTYIENNLTLLKSGTSASPIKYISDTKWGAKIQSTFSYFVLRNNGDYVTIDGFEVEGDSGSCIGIGNWGGNTSVINNHVHDIPAPSTVCGGNGGAGIHDSNYAKSNDDIIGNYVHNIGSWPTPDNGVHGIYHANAGGHVMNNISFRNAGWGIHLWHAADGVVVSNNTTFNNNKGGILFGAGDSPGGVVADNMVITNNTAVNNDLYGIREYAYTPSALGSNNKIYNNIAYNNATANIATIKALVSGNITADPQFVYYTGDTDGDYHLKETSQGINNGTSLGATSYDYDNSNPRPAGTGYDIGAYEYSPDTLTINAISKNLRIGETSQIISSSDLSSALYVSDNPSIATVDSAGVVTAVANGVANVTATVTNGTSKSGTIQIKVAERLQTVTLQTSEPRPEVGQAQQYTVTGLMSDGSAAALNNAAIRYYMNGRVVASVSSAGIVTGISSGTDTLNVVVTLDGMAKRASTLVTIDPPTLASVALTVPSDTLVKGEITQLTVSGTSTNGKAASLKTATIAYHSSNPAIASVSPSGLVTAVAPGSVAITVDVTLNGNTFSATRMFTIQTGLSMIYKFTQLPIISKTTGTIIYAPNLQLEANSPGHSITFGLDVPETHLYQLKLRTNKAFSYGNYTIKLDGLPLSEYNFFGSTGIGTIFDPIGTMQLTTGVHQITFENIGKSEVSTNYKMGVIELQLFATQDTTPPTSSADVQGSQSNGWCTTDVQVNLNAVDADSGVSRTEYRLDQASEWETYMAPITLSSEGIHSLSYRSTDVAGNVDQVKTVEVKIDKTAPLLSIQLDKTSIWPPNHKMETIHATLNSSDAASGVASVVLTSITTNEPENGQSDIQANIGSADTSFSLRAERAGGGTGRIYTIMYTITDIAGNQEAASVTVTVPHNQ